ncbi:MAG: creatininase family protein [Paracoccaceae bacterium]|nr:creatininase family protein [Paracoccaceae bacterium]
MGMKDWADFRAPDFQSIDPMKTIAILPTAAIEQHGPHLPLGTDTLIGLGMLEELRRQAPADMDLRVLPIQAVGKSNEHLWAAGTLTLTAATALAVWTEIGLSVARAGIRKIAIVNSHGGNLDLVSILSRELRVQADMLAVKCQWGSFGAPEGLYSAQEDNFGIHGGDVETSLMLHFRPKAVDMSKAKDFRSSAETSAISPIGPVSYGWIASDLNPDGTVGEAHLASAEKGAATAAHQVAGFVDLLRKMDEMALPGT